MKRLVRWLSVKILNPGVIHLVFALLRLYLGTLRLSMDNDAAFRARAASGEKIIAALWHQRILAVMPHAMRYRDFGPAVMISKSRDGDLIADVYRRLGFRPVRGSSSRGGKEGLLAMIDFLKENPLAVHILDGPQGPRGVVKAGVIAMASLSGAAIVPAYVSPTRAWILNNWDRFLLPKPFSRIVLRFGEPVSIPDALTPEAFEAMRHHLENVMREGQQRLDNDVFGRDDLLL